MRSQNYVFRENKKLKRGWGFTLGGMRGQKLSKYSLKEALGDIKVQMGETCSLLDLSLSLSLSFLKEMKWNGNQKTWNALLTADFSYGRSNVAFER